MWTLSQYAKQQCVSYKTAWRWYKAGQLDAYQTPTGMVIVRDPKEVRSVTGRIALYARVSSQDQKQDLERQLERLRDYAASRGYTVAKEVTELASGLNDQRPKLMKLLQDTSIGTIVIEHRDRLTRFGYPYIEAVLATQGRRLEVLFPTDTDNELVDDFVSVITSMAARISGRRNSKRRAEQIKRCVEQAMKAEDK
ncbi:MAG: IS607 family transposase [Ktedonobacteraceae bacterium]